MDNSNLWNNRTGENMQNKLKWYIRQSIANWLRNEIRKQYEAYNKLDVYLENIKKINKMVDADADHMIEFLDDRLLSLFKDLFE